MSLLAKCPWNIQRNSPHSEIVMARNKIYKTRNMSELKKYHCCIQSQNDYVQTHWAPNKMPPPRNEQEKI